jgi:NAD(P)-dependent dehydrogenase (short-subunit alcohol dehydrogenase family)
MSEARDGGRLAGKIAIVTGAASGIGATTAETFARAGAQVVVADINLEAAEAQAAKIRAAGFEARALRVDLGEPESIRALIADTVTACGGLDVLHNNAAATQLSSTRDTDVEHMDTEVWDALMRINLRGTMLAIQSAIPEMRKRGRGAIINTSSGSSLAGAGSFTAYAVTKAGINVLTEYVAVQHGKEGIRCNAICPGLIVTPSTASTYAAAGGPGELMLRHHLTARLGKPEDVAGMALFLASDDAEFVTGQVICVDGGASAVHPFNADMMEFMKQFASGAGAR